MKHKDGRLFKQKQPLVSACLSHGMTICCMLLLSVNLASISMAYAEDANLKDSNTKEVIAKKTYPVDPESGLIMAPGWEVVNYQCNACHTSMIIPQNSGTKAVWRETIQWMIDTQGLWDLSETWDPVLDYLSTHYGEVKMDMEKFRRLPLDPALLPPPPKEDY
jgi:cytochrome c5